ncbi:MAG: hypothetical protein KDA93_12390 [Planctomycetaceae bacterium]|nr:hypothetical protein [Planctomycetaceae bacterium]
MNFDTVDLQRSGDVTYTVRRWARDARPFISIIHLAFAGTYRDGSSGAPDAHYIHGIASITDGAWRPCAVILDFSSLSYEWGDEMSLVLPPDDAENAVVVSDKCRRAISTIRFGINTDRDITELSNFFDNFDDARKYVAERQVTDWNDSVKRSTPFDETELITLADMGIDG